MEEFIQALNDLYAQDTAPVTENCFTGVEELAYKAADLLINRNGSCNWDNIGKLRTAGFRVFAGEKNSFSWPTGCIQKRGDSRILIYG